MPDEKAFYDVRKVSESFQSRVLKHIGGEAISTVDALLWSAQAQLCVAQQLAVISASLKKVVEAIENVQGSIER